MVREKRYSGKEKKINLNTIQGAAGVGGGESRNTTVQGKKIIKEQKSTSERRRGEHTPLSRSGITYI